MSLRRVRVAHAVFIFAQESVRHRTCAVLHSPPRKQQSLHAVTHTRQICASDGHSPRHLRTSPAVHVTPVEQRTAKVHAPTNSQTSSRLWLVHKHQPKPVLPSLARYPAAPTMRPPFSLPPLQSVRPSQTHAPQTGCPPQHRAAFPSLSSANLPHIAARPAARQTCLRQRAPIVPSLSLTPLPHRHPPSCPAQNHPRAAGISRLPSHAQKNACHPGW